MIYINGTKATKNDINEQTEKFYKILTEKE